MERNWSTAAAVMANPTEAREEIHALRAEAERLREALSQAVRYVEVQHAYRGAMTAAEVEAAIIANASIAEVRIGANSCNTLAAFDLFKARAALGAAE